MKTLSLAVFALFIASPAMAEQTSCDVMKQLVKQMNVVAGNIASAGDANAQIDPVTEMQELITLQREYDIERPFCLELMKK